MANDKEASDILKTLRRTGFTSKRTPVSVYRLNFSRHFTFRDAADIVPYLAELGITDCYASPYLKARSGSLHGYDITDHGQLNPEIGTAEEYEHFVQRLHEHGMGQIIDFIPNHMGIFDNPRWLDVLENGPGSPSARFFDIDWEPIKAELHGKVLLPILEDFYGNVLRAGRLTVGFDRGSFTVSYEGHRLPIGPKTAVVVLEACLGPLRDALGVDHPDYLELQSVITACKNLPERSETEAEKVLERQREKEIIKKRLRELHSKNRMVEETLGAEIRKLNGLVGEDASFGRLHELLERQAYRLSYWRVAADEINYRRFFDVNELVAIKMEDPLVFEESHRLVRELLAKGAVNGIRVDHVDGLFNPADYLWRLQSSYWGDLNYGPSLLDYGLKQLPHGALEEQLCRLFKTERETNPESVQPLYIVVEKILGENEALRETWPVDGTTGYEFTRVLNGLFVDGKNKRKLLYTYRQFTGNQATFEEIMYQSKGLVMRTSLSAEVNLLAHQLNRVSERSWQYRDFTLNSLRDAIGEVIASFPVYRTYLNAYEEVVDERDKNVINMAINRAQRRNPAVSSAVFDFIRDTLLLRYPVGMSEEGRNEQRLFVMRFQQFTGPAMAKGVEDTAFYIYNPLVSLNEVGGSPHKFGRSLEEFHGQNKRRHRDMPHSFISTSTHDSKRGEDVRARLNVLSEIPGQWRAALKRWSQLNQMKKTAVSNEAVPDGNEEYLIYQTLLGTHPAHSTDKEEGDRYRGRLQQHMLKALREAKVHTSWISPNTAYEEGIASFIRDILDPALSGEFLADFTAFLKPVATCGICNSLSQVVLKLFSPGVPDTYQGNELWAFNLTDPDNRQPVDFNQRIQLLERIKHRLASSGDCSGFIRQLVETKEDGLIKLYVTWRSLNYRRENVALFDAGSYLPVKVAGAKRDHVCAYAWKKGKTTLVVAAPRLIAGLTRVGDREPVGEEAWADTRLVLPAKLQAGNYKHLFTGETIRPLDRTGRPELRLADALATFPVAALGSHSGRSRASSPDRTSSGGSWE
ncbi:MAG: malto-oligosyltrehalose synthase [Chloroflexi bacterium]|nr:malto-oligosyltrehalose synthase [Chloroflexota bacterium]